MAIFGKLKVEPIVQVNDLTRINATDSVVSKGEAAITLVEIDPGDGTGFVDVTPAPATKSSEYYLDWEYSTDAGSPYTVQVRITTDGAPQSFSESITVLSEADDNLWSNDNDLKLHEPDIDKWIINGRNTFKDIHRRAQTLILDHLDREGWRTMDGSKITKAEILDTSEVKEWATYWALSLIYSGRSNAINDVFEQNANQYKAKGILAADKVYIAYDWNKDATLSPDEKKIPFNTIRVEKR